jgi:hypothetical protein
MKEVAYAARREAANEAGLPHIVPVPIEGPPPVPPPDELQHLHFNDRLLYFIDEHPREWQHGLSKPETSRLPGS